METKKEELCKELCKELGVISKSGSGSVSESENSEFNNFKCFKCKNLKDKFDSINYYYDIKEKNRLENMIHEVANFDNNKLKLFAIEIYNILNQAQTEYKDETEFKSESIKNINTIKNLMNDIEFTKMKTLSSNNIFDDFDRDNFGIVNNYILNDILGRGTQGIVYLAFDKKTNEKYAIKELFFRRRKYRITLNNPLENLKKEISIMKNADHENIVKLYDVIENPKTNNIYLVMQYIEGGPILKNSETNEKEYNQLPLNIIIEYTKQIISGLRYLHYNNIYHRDIKPENILVDKNGKIFLSDFGVSEILDKKTNSLKNKKGTMMFFSPELFLYGSSVDGSKADIWALGVTIFLMRYGYFPFDGDNYEKLQENVLNSSPKYNSDIDEVEKDFFNKIFAKDQESRITLKEMKEHKFLEQHSITKKVL